MNIFSKQPNQRKQQELIGSDQDPFKNRSGSRLGTLVDENRNRQLPATKDRSRDPFGVLLVQRLLQHCGDPPIRIVLPDGQEISPANGNSVGTIRVADYRTIFALVMDPLFQFGEAYANETIEIEGDLTECLTVIFRCMNQQKNLSLGQRLFYRIHRTSNNSLKAAKQNIHHHYDLGNDFYQLWLDEKMLYTCAYFARADFSLEQAQLAKMDHVCRKLRLKPGMTVVDAGCGWGALAMHMAAHYGAQVKAFNISREQIDWARQTARQQGLANQVEFVLEDWRNIKGNFDAFASVGMLEHVGVKNYARLGQTIRRCLKPGGLGLIHTIGQNRAVRLNPWIERRIFPGAYPPTLKEMMEIFEFGDFQVLDVENLRLHYAETLRHWLDRFEKSKEVVRGKFDDRFVRMWQMYLASSAAAFETGCMQLFQVMFAAGASNNVQRTRADLYQAHFEQRVDS